MTDNVTSTGSIPTTRMEWLAFFRQHYGNVRPLVRFIGGSQLSNQLDKFRDIGSTESITTYTALAGLLHKAIADVVASDVDYMTGWYELITLCNTHTVLVRAGKDTGDKEKAAKATYCKV